MLGSSGNRVGAWKDGGGSQGSPLLCKEGRGEVEIWPAYTNHGSPARHSPWCLYPSLCLPLQRGGNWMAPTQKPEEPSFAMNCELTWAVSSVGRGADS